MAAQNLLPLVLSAKCKGWRSEDGVTQEADTEFQSVRKRVLEKERYTCRYCGFVCNPSLTTPKANYYMQVHHRDDDHTNNSMSNLVTFCMHCHAVQHMGYYGSKHNAVVVWLPEISQAALSNLCRAVLVARRFGDLQSSDKGPTGQAARDMADAANSFYNRVYARKDEAEQRYRTSNPADIANLMIQPEFPSDAYARRHQTFAGLRLLLAHEHIKPGEPSDAMPAIVDSWMANGGPFKALRPPDWMSLIKGMPALR